GIRDRNVTGVQTCALPILIVFHCTANSMAEGQAGEARILELVEKASGCQALTTGLAVKEALAQLRLRKLVLISPYVKATNEHERSEERRVGKECRCGGERE